MFLIWNIKHFTSLLRGFQLREIVSDARMDLLRQPVETNIFVIAHILNS